MHDESLGLISPRLEWLDTTPQESCFRFHTSVSQMIGSANTGLITKLLCRFVGLMCLLKYLIA